MDDVGGEPVGRGTADDVAREVAGLAAVVPDRVDELAAAMVELIQDRVPVYRTGVVTPPRVHQACAGQIRSIFERILMGSDARPAPSAELGRERAKAGVPLTAVEAGYRIGFRHLWEQVVGIAAAAEGDERGDGDARTIMPVTAGEAASLVDGRLGVHAVGALGHDRRHLNSDWPTGADRRLGWSRWTFSVVEGH